MVTFGSPQHATMETYYHVSPLQLGISSPHGAQQQTRHTLSGNSLRQTVHTHRASLLGTGG